MNWQTAFERALALDEQGDIDAAVVCLDGVLGELPDAAPVLKFAGQLYQRLGADRQSLVLLQRALALTPDDADLLLSLGYHHVDNGSPDLALDLFRRHLVLAPQSFEGQIYLGRTLDWVGRLEEAEAALVQAVALKPEDVGGHCQLGRVQLRLGKLTEAIRAFAQADQLDPGNVLAEIGRRRAEALATKKPPRLTQSAQTVVCIKSGTKYKADYANRLAAMVRRNTSRAVRVVCFTDDTRGLDGGVEAQPLPADGLKGWWNKVALFRETLPGVSGRVLYLDLDVVMDNDYVPGFNSSVMLFDVGACTDIWTRFSPDTAARVDGDQDWVALMAPDATVWPAGWCVPYRLRAAQSPPSDTKVVVFSGRPNPHEYPADWVRAAWR